MWFAVQRVIFRAPHADTMPSPPEQSVALWLLGSVYWCPLRRKLKALAAEMRKAPPFYCVNAQTNARAAADMRSAAVAAPFFLFAADNKSSGRLRMWGVSAAEHFFSLRLGIFEVRFFNDSQSKGTALLLQNEVATRLYRSRIFRFFMATLV